VKPIKKMTMLKRCQKTIQAANTPGVTKCRYTLFHGYDYTHP
jgi:hypothetical protein